MAKPAPKTQKTTASVAQFIAAVDNEVRRKDAKALDKRLRAITGQKPAMWGPSIIGYGQYQSPTGLWPRAGFSPRKANLVVYLAPGFQQDAALKRLGKHKFGVACLYLNALADTDEGALDELMARSWGRMEKAYP